MSEVINNRVYRQKVLKELITDLHQGSRVEEVKSRFAALIEGVSASEIAEMEQNYYRQAGRELSSSGKCTYRGENR